MKKNEAFYNVNANETSGMKRVSQRLSACISERRAESMSHVRCLVV